MARLRGPPPGPVAPRLRPLPPPHLPGTLARPRHSCDFWPQRRERGSPRCGSSTSGPCTTSISTTRCGAVVERASPLLSPCQALQPSTAAASGRSAGALRAALFCGSTPPFQHHQHPHQHQHYIVAPYDSGAVVEQASPSFLRAAGPPAPGQLASGRETLRRSRWTAPGRSGAEGRTFRRVPLPQPQGPVGPSALLVGDKNYSRRCEQMSGSP